MADALPFAGWPESFITVSRMIDGLCNPVATPPRGDENVPSFNVVVPRYVMKVKGHREVA